MLKQFFLTLTVFLGIDAIWLLLISKNFYDKQLSGFKRHLNLPAALLSYLLIVIGLVVFVLPGFKGPSWQVFLRGALFGLICYGVYDLVNLATLKNWTITMTIVDMCWGAIVCGSVSLIVSWILK